MLRLGASVLSALLLGTYAVKALFGPASIGSDLDSALLVAAPALALAYLFYGLFPSIQAWLRGRRVVVLVALCLPAVIGGGSLAASTNPVLPALVGWLAPMFLMFVLMTPAASSIERALAGRSLPDYLVALLAALFLTYLSVRFLDGVFETAIAEACFAAGLVLPGSVFGTHAVRKVRASMGSGLLSRPGNAILAALPPLFLLSFAGLSSRVPGSFNWHWPAGRVAESGLLIASSALASVWGLWALHQIDGSGLSRRLRRLPLASSITANWPGVYAAAVFFLIHLLIARAFNHPALSLNTVLFESDAGPWLHILGSPDAEPIGRAVHPLVLILVRPGVRLLALLLGGHWRLAPMIAVAAMSALAVLLAWIFVERATHQRRYAFLFAILLGSSATHLLFGSLTETYSFAVVSLLWFLLLIQARESRLRVLVPAGLLVFGITITNLAQPVIALLFNGFGLRRLARLCAIILAAAVALTAVTGAVFPNRQTLFFVPADIAFEANFVEPSHRLTLGGLRQRTALVGRTMFLYAIVAPRPLEVIAHKEPRDTIDFKTYDARTGRLASYTGLGNLPLGAWLLMLTGGLLLAIRRWRSSAQPRLMLALLGCLAFNAALHLLYGSELFLYTPNSTYALVLFLALAYSTLADRAWLRAGLTALVIIFMLNNMQFLLGMLRAASPFFAAAY